MKQQKFYFSIYFSFFLFISICSDAETHFDVMVVSEKFEKLTRLEVYIFMWNELMNCKENFKKKTEN